MTNCKDCTTNCVYRGKDNEARCGSFVGTITNADRFRAMSDDEQQKCVRRFWEIEDFADWLKQTVDLERK